MITVKEAAQRLGLSDKTVYGMIEAGALPGYRFGRAVRVDEDELQAWRECCRVRPKNAPPPSGKPGRPVGSKNRDPRWRDAPESEIYTGLACLTRNRKAASV